MAPGQLPEAPQAVSRATSRRATGATTITVGNEIGQASSHAPIQAPKTPGVGPSARSVAMPQTMQDISPEKTKLKRSGAKRAGIMVNLGLRAQI